MNPTDNIIRLMSPKDRKAHGLVTSEEAQAKFIAKNERELQNQLASLLRLRGIWFVQSRMDRATTNSKGTPDFVFPYCNFFMAWEVKFGKSKLSEEQERVRDSIIRQRGLWTLITSVEQAKKILDSMKP